jgi:hypothetical protein
VNPRITITEHREAGIEHAALERLAVKSLLDTPAKASERRLLVDDEALLTAVARLESTTTHSSTSSQ